jgi:hypothetical protein
MINTLKTVVTVLCISTVGFSSGIAAADDPNEMHEVRGYFMIGSAPLDLDPINDRLAGKGFTEISDKFISVGGGMFMREHERFLFGVEGHLLLADENTSMVGGKQYASTAVAGYGFLNTGYLVYAGDRFDLYPVFGIGLGGMGLKLGQASFDDILDNPQSPAYLTTYSFLLNVALGADYKIKLPGNNHDGFFSVGVRGGYAFAPFDSGWNMEDWGYSLSGDPEGGIEGPYVRFTIGGGGQVSMKKK